MDFDAKRRDGKIFPELCEPARETETDMAGRAAEPARDLNRAAEERARGELRESSVETHARATDWREEPLLDREPEPRAREIRRPMAARDPERGSTGALWLALTFLLVVLAGASFYGYRTLLDANIRLSQIPSILKSVATTDGRIKNLESQLQAWSGSLQDVSGRVDKLETRVTVDYRGARRHAEILTAQLQKQIQEKMDARDRVVDAMLGQLDASQKNDEARVTGLKQQLADAQNQVAALRQQTDGDLASLQQRVDGNQEQTQNLTQQMARRRVNFEVSKNRIARLSPDISMDLTATDISYQRFSGWVYFEPDGRYLWVRDQGVAQPVVFYDQQQGKQYQVVVTSIRQSSAAGYLLLPAANGAPSEGAGGTPSGR